MHSRLKFERPASKGIAISCSILHLVDYTSQVLIDMFCWYRNWCAPT